MPILLVHNGIPGLVFSPSWTHRPDAKAYPMPPEVKLPCQIEAQAVSERHLRRVFELWLRH